MKALVVYSSQTGNTEKLAKAVQDALPGGTECLPVDQAPEPAGYDFVAVGFWFKAGQPDPKSAEYLQKIQGAKVFLFATHGAAADSSHAATGMATARELAAGGNVAGHFNCPGEVNAKHLEMVNAKPTPPPWAKDAPAAAGRPDASDLAAVQQAVQEALSAA